MPIAENHLDKLPIPDGYRIYERWLEVAGLGHRKAEAARFIQGQDQALEFAAEPDNPFDPNAIRLVGCCRERGQWARFHIGYVERELASAIVAGGFWGIVRPRLMRTYMSDAGFMEIRYQIIGPKERFKTWNVPRKDSPAPQQGYVPPGVELGRPAQTRAASTSRPKGCALCLATLALLTAVAGALAMVP